MWEYEQQLFFESSKILYRQIPLKAATEKVCCSISDSFGQALYNDSISIVKSYCIIVEYLLKGISKRYIVTMLPKYSLDCFNEKCTYLEKPNYSGLIIFSDTMGKFQKIEHYKNGLILNGELLTAQEISDGVNTANPEDITYLTIYVPKTAKSQIIPTKASQERSFWTDALQTKSNDDDETWHDLLEEIVVVATRPTPEDNENQTAENDESGGGGITPTLPGINDSGGGGSSSGSSQEEEEPVKYTVTLSIDGGGSVNGGGTYTANSNVTISATPNSGYVFSGWDGDFVSRANPASFSIQSNLRITGHFYTENSDCGKLSKAISHYDSLIVYRNKMLANPEYEYGYTKSPTKSRVSKSLINKVKTTTFPGMTEMVHTHCLEIHLSLQDLKTLYSSYARGYITDVENFKYTVVSPEYFIVLQIEDEEKIKTLLDNGFLEESITDNTYTLNEKYEQDYKDLIFNKQDYSIEDYFSDFIRYMNNIESGFSISLHRTDTTTNQIISKYIKDSTDIQKLLELQDVCK